MIKIIVFALLLGSSAFGSSIQERIQKVTAPEIGKIRKGAVIGIFDKGNISFLRFGRLATGKTAPDENTMFEIGSLTKTFTSLLFSIAIDKGLVKPETTLAEIHPAWASEKRGSITLLELSTHRAGLPKLPCDFHYRRISNPYIDYSEKELINSISDSVLAAHPECEISSHPSASIIYSNWGAALLGYALSVRTQLSYGELLKEWITGPLLMKDTVVSLSSDQKSRLAKGHTSKLRPTSLWGRSIMHGNGAILSTANDLMIYARAMLRADETPFASSIRRTQMRQYQYMAYGWHLTPKGSIWHNGMTGGFASLFKAYIHEDLAVFELSNTATDIGCLIEAVEELPCPQIGAP
jgi:CubicO group peptidase (beta-lactamase class C family)